MSSHWFAVPCARVQLRWREAFTDADIVTDVSQLIRGAPVGGVAWIDAAQTQWIESVRKARPELPIVAMSLNPSSDEGMAAFEVGVRGYCHAMAAPEMLRQVAVVVSNGGLWLGAELMTRAAVALSRVIAPSTDAVDVLAVLTPRERAVAVEVASGASNKEIARRLDITPRTVKAHTGAIFDKLQVRDRLHLVVLLRRAGTPRSSTADQ